MKRPSGFLARIVIAVFTALVILASARAQLTQKGSWSLTSQNPYDICVSGNYAYVTTSMGWLKILDITDPENPIQTSELFLISSSATLMREVAVAGDYAYVAVTSIPGASKADVAVVSVANKGAPTRVGVVQVGGDAHSVTIDNGRLYVGSSAGLSIYSLAAPADPQYLGKFDIPAQGSADNIREIVAKDGLAYVAAGYNGLQIIDVSFPSAPSRVGSVSVGDRTMAMDIVLSGDSALVATTEYPFGSDSRGRLKTIDVSNPTSPTEVFSSEVLESQIGVVALVGNVAAVGGLTTHLFDASNPRQPAKIGAFSTLGHAGPLADIEVMGSSVYLVNPTGLRLVDFSTPSIPKLQAVYPLSSRMTQVVAAGGYAYAMDWFIGVRIFDVTDPSAPKSAGQIYLPAPVYLVIEGGRLFVASTSGFSIYSLANPTHPEKIGEYLPGKVADLAVRGNLVFLTGLIDFSIRVINVADPANPAVIANYGGVGGKIGIVDDYVFVGGSINDASNPANIHEVGTVQGAVQDFAALGTRMLMTSTTLRAVDVLNPPNFVTDSVDLWLGQVAASDGRALHAGANGITLIDARNVFDLKIVAQTNWPAFDVDIVGNVGYSVGTFDPGYTEGKSLFTVWETTLPELPDDPRLEVFKSGAALVIKWPDSFGAASVYGTTDLSQSWQLVTSSPVHDGNAFYYTNRFPTAAAQFYKLVK